MRAVANALVGGAEADAGSGHPTRWRVFTIGGREAYQGNDSSRVATLQAVALCGW